MFYRKQTYNNKSKLKKISHSSRFNESVSFITNLFSRKKINLLDFGCGDGYFLSLINKDKKNWKLSGYDPSLKVVSEMKRLLHNSNTKNIKVFSNFNSIKNKYDVVTCFETLEHFNKKMQLQLINQIKSRVKPGGLILISVPIEIYLSGFLKGIYRYLINQKNNRTSLVNLFKILFNLKIDRKKTNKYISSHVGFNYLELIKLLNENNFKIIKKFYTPFGFLGPLLNSQVFLVIDNKLC
jgi:2-polyprenyl-3-methyl-5-hydroxy-6-metoxy-1,4-benzoquinol methylase